MTSAQYFAVSKEPRYSLLFALPLLLLYEGLSLLLAGSVFAASAPASAFHWTGTEGTQAAPMPAVPGNYQFNPTTPAGWAVFMNPAAYPMFMNPTTYGPFMQPQFYMQFAVPNLMATWMNPASYAAYMNPAGYMQFMNPGTYGPMMNPNTYLAIMTRLLGMAHSTDQQTADNFLEQWMNLGKQGSQQ